MSLSTDQSMSYLEFAPLHSFVANRVCDRPAVPPLVQGNRDLVAQPDLVALGGALHRYHGRAAVPHEVDQFLQKNPAI